MTDDGDIYDVEAYEKGNEVVDIAGKKVKATGIVKEADEMKIILILSYEAIEE